jgi:RimJ/RimL family protein N-acetyltransferase
MTTHPIDRANPPRRVRYDDGARAFLLRPWELTDTDALLAAVDASRAELIPFMPWAATRMARDAEARLIAGFHAAYWAGRENILGVFSPAGEVLGGCGLHPRTPLNPAALEVGYWCHSAHAGRGLTTLVSRSLVALGFECFAADRVQVLHDEQHGASRRVCEKTGFVLEGVQRNVLAARTAEELAAGAMPSGRAFMYGLVPADRAGLAWYRDHLRCLVVEDALGGERRLGE